ncbi:MAG: AAA family ATPase [Deltaproteobacteria bacterium]|nr:MAG: AAA family ATPase [Deltaproteobacteria bacterium]
MPEQNQVITPPDLLEKEALDIAQEEDARWRQVHAAIVEEIRVTKEDFEKDRTTARDLTSQIVASRRDEDKAALASDEAVAHGLSKLRKEKGSDLSALLEEPYFARVVTEEENRTVEFRLGTASFPAQRIIDWRKAPISKLYYDYKEGDDFGETIQGVDREGVIKIRRGFSGVENELHRIETSKGIVVNTHPGWKFTPKEQALSRTDEHDAHLPSILSLITPEQFGLITRDIQKPIVIQGIAGSGKTTVGLHRLAWLLHEDNSDASAERCLVVMHNRSLKAYVENTLPELKIKNVPIRTYTEWASTLTDELVGARPRAIMNRSRETELFKSSSFILNKLHDYVSQNPHNPAQSYVEELFSFYRNLLTQDLLWKGWDKVKVELKQQVDRKQTDLQDDSLLLHLVYAENGYYPSATIKSLAQCDHIMIDEAQDFGLVEIRALLNALNEKGTVSIVGDTAQKIVSGRDFGSWEELLRDAGFADTTPIQLTVSYRSTQEIMSLAAKVRGTALTKNELLSSGRHGPAPTWTRTENPQVLPNRIGQWVAARSKDSSKSLSAIICRYPKQAQELVDQLRKLGYTSVRLGHRDQFDFSPGIVITNIHQVKGLEFRNVLIVDPSEANYPPPDPNKPGSEEGQNLLYVAITRAEVRLDFIGSEKQTSLLPRI